jgi:hypothetical protein
MKGRVILYDYDGTEIASNSYESLKDRLKRLSTWKHQVGLNRYAKMYYHVVPDARPDFVSEIGVNVRSIAKKYKR